MSALNLYKEQVLSCIPVLAGVGSWDAPTEAWAGWKRKTARKAVAEFCFEMLQNK